MESDNRDTPAKSSEKICALEWVALAMDAARRIGEDRDEGPFRLDYSQIYTDELIRL
jgi:hypothetical protein